MFCRLLCLTVSLGLTWAFGDVLNLSTGIDTTGANCDVHWTVSAIPTSDVPFYTACPGNAAQVVTSTDPDFFSGWPVDTSDIPYSESDWIARDASIVENGDNDYSVNFWLDSVSGATLNGFAAIDDIGGALLNGNLIPGTSGIVWNTLQPVYYDASQSENDYFQVGWNTLTLETVGSNNDQEGVRFLGTVTGAGASYSDPPAVPEPSFAIPLLLAGLVAVPLALRRRPA